MPKMTILRSVQWSWDAAQFRSAKTTSAKLAADVQPLSAVDDGGNVAE